MPYDIIPFIIIILCFIAIVVIVGRRIPELRVLDINTIAEVREKQMKKSILEIRLKRNLQKFFKVFAIIARPLFEKTLLVIRGYYYRILDLEKKYKEESQEKGIYDPREKVQKYLHDAKILLGQDGSGQGAEDSYIKAIEIDNKNIEAYNGLYMLYQKLRDWKKTREVGKYVIKLCYEKYKKNQSVESRQELAGIYSSLGEIEQNLGNMAMGSKYYKEALKLIPNNPKFLDLLVTISIIMKDKKTAKNALKMLKLADPENQKIHEFEKEVGDMWVNAP